MHSETKHSAFSTSLSHLPATSETMKIPQRDQYQHCGEGLSLRQVLVLYVLSYSRPVVDSRTGLLLYNVQYTSARTVVKGSTEQHYAVVQNLTSALPQPLCWARSDWRSPKLAGASCRSRIYLDSIVKGIQLGCNYSSTTQAFRLWQRRPRRVLREIEFDLAHPGWDICHNVAPNREVFSRERDTPSRHFVIIQGQVIEYVVGILPIKSRNTLRSLQIWSRQERQEAAS